MGLINPTPGVINFDGINALQPLFDAARASGLWIVLRPGVFSGLSIKPVPTVLTMSRAGPVGTSHSGQAYALPWNSISTQRHQRAGYLTGPLLKSQVACAPVTHLGAQPGKTTSKRSSM